ncbi:type 2 isopentenyl-diphosphate Delta-isomerase, partial [Vibrio vulnificus]
KIMTMLDAKDINELTHKDMIFNTDLLSWIEQRGLDIQRG